MVGKTFVVVLASVAMSQDPPGEASVEDAAQTLRGDQPLFGPRYSRVQGDASGDRQPNGGRRRSEADPNRSPYSPLSGKQYGANTDGPRSYRPAYTEVGDYRQPIAIEWLDSSTAMIATRKSGQLFELQVELMRLEPYFTDEQCQWGVIQPLSSTLFAVAEQAGDRVVVFEKEAERWRWLTELAAPGFPNALAWSAESQTLFASGQWSQRLYRWRLDVDSQQWTELPSTDLPVHGGPMLLLTDHDRLLIGDVFGRPFAILDAQTAEVVKQGEFYGHNIPEFALVDDGQRILFPHQLLNEFTQTVRSDITWGGLLSNSLRWLKTERLLQYSGRDMFRRGSFYPLGTPGDGAGDPTSMSLSGDGRIAITLGGTNRLAIGDLEERRFLQFDVGLRPVDCLFTHDNSQVIVVNQFSDSLSIVDLEDQQVAHLELGPVRPPSLAERGEQLFFHSRLAHDGWMSCHSCHSQGHTNGLTNDNITDGSYGTPKRILSLLGQAETAPYSWGGGIETLEQQIAHSIEFTLASDDPVNPEQVEAIAAYIRTLPPPPSLTVARGELAAAAHKPTARKTSSVAHPSADSSEPAGDEEFQPAAGRQLFESLGCADCHAGEHFTTPDAYDVGLIDREAMRLFNPPSLVGVSQRQRTLFHDGSAGSLRELLTEHRHQLPRELNSEELETLLEYLSAL